MDEPRPVILSFCSGAVKSLDAMLLVVWLFSFALFAASSTADTNDIRDATSVDLIILVDSDLLVQCDEKMGVRQLRDAFFTIGLDETRVAMAVYSDRVQFVQNFTRDVADLERAIATMCKMATTINSTTNRRLPLQEIEAELRVDQRADADNVLVIVNKECPVRGSQSIKSAMKEIEEAADRLQQKGAAIFVVQVGNETCIDGTSVIDHQRTVVGRIHPARRMRLRTVEEIGRNTFKNIANELCRFDQVCLSTPNEHCDSVWIKKSDESEMCIGQKPTSQKQCDERVCRRDCKDYWRKADCRRFSGDRVIHDSCQRCRKPPTSPKRPTTTSSSSLITAEPSVPPAAAAKTKMDNDTDTDAGAKANPSGRANDEDKTMVWIGLGLGAGLLVLMVLLTILAVIMIRRRRQGRRRSEQTVTTVTYASTKPADASSIIYEDANPSQMSESSQYYEAVGTTITAAATVPRAPITTAKTAVKKSGKKASGKAPTSGKKQTAYLEVMPSGKTTVVSDEPTVLDQSSSDGYLKIGATAIVRGKPEKKAAKPTWMTKQSGKSAKTPTKRKAGQRIKVGEIEDVSDYEYIKGS